jgi:regulator of replication initiation timing
VIATTNPPKIPPKPELSETDRLREENAQQRQQIVTLTEQLIKITQKMDELLEEVKSLKAHNTSLQQGQPTRPEAAMNVDTSFSSQTDDDI